MITRPLDLASKLRPEPRSFYWVFFVNAGVIVLFFSIFGSRFVLAPGLGVDFRLPVASSGTLIARMPTHVVQIVRSGQIITNDGWQTMEAFATWLQKHARDSTSPILLVEADSGVPLSVLTQVADLGTRAGFEMLWATTTEDSSAATAKGR